MRIALQKSSRRRFLDGGWGRSTNVEGHIAGGGLASIGGAPPGPSRPGGGVGARGDSKPVHGRAVRGVPRPKGTMSRFGTTENTSGLTEPGRRQRTTPFVHVRKPSIAIPENGT